MKSTPDIKRIPSTMTPADLVAWRKAHGLSQEAVGHMLGMARRTYLYLEKGETRSGLKPPKIPRLVELATKGLDAEIRVVKLRLGTRSLSEANGKSLDTGT